jgi:hypothetical protein
MEFYFFYKGYFKFSIYIDLVGQDDQMTTLRCLSFAQQSKENSLVQKDSSVKKSPMIVQVKCPIRLSQQFSNKGFLKLGKK